MKKPFLAAAASMLGIIVIRIILSVTVSESVAEVFTNISLTALFLYFVLISIRKNKEKDEQD